MKSGWFGSVAGAAFALAAVCATAAAPPSRQDGALAREATRTLGASRSLGRAPDRVDATVVRPRDPCGLDVALRVFRDSPEMTDGDVMWALTTVAGERRGEYDFSDFFGRHGGSWVSRNAEGWGFGEEPDPPWEWDSDPPGPFY